MRAPSVVAHRPRSRSREPARRGASGSGAVRAGRSVGRSVVAWRGVAWRAVSECRGRSGGGPQPASAGCRAPRRRRSCGVGRSGEVPGGGADRPDRGPLRAERRGGPRRQDPAPPLPTPPARPPARSGARRSRPRRRRVLRPPTPPLPNGKDRTCHWDRTFPLFRRKTHLRPCPNVGTPLAVMVCVEGQPTTGIRETGGSYREGVLSNVL